MKDELHRPLGVSEPRAGSGNAMRIALSLLLVAAGVGAGALLTSRIATQREEPQIAARPMPTATAPAAEEAPVAPPEAEEAPDPSAAAIEEAVPSGTIEALTPVPMPAPRRQEVALAHLPDAALLERGEHGMLPVRGPDGQRPMDVYSRPPATEGNFGVARVVIIVGGVGISQTGSQMAVQKLPPAVTLAFAPSGNSLVRWMQAARRRGFELLVQAPMEPFGYPQNSPGEHTLTVDSDPAARLSDLHWTLSRLTNYVGVMNFLGGRFMGDAQAMKPVFDDLASRGLLFVDDGSLRNTMTEPVAKASLLPFTRAHIQIDAVRTRQDITARLEELAQQAKRTGLAIGVANAFPDSIELIAKFAEGAGAKGIEITPVSAIVTDPEKRSQ